MYYKKHDNLPKLDDEIKYECIKIVENNLKNNVPKFSWYQEYELKNKNSIAYVESPEEISVEQSGGIGIYIADEYINKKICDCFGSNNHPLLKSNQFLLQFSTGGNFIAPHIDDPNGRPSGMLYLLKAGGSNVRTRWYTIKDEYKNLELTETKGIPYSRLTLVEDQRLEEDTWHWLNFKEPHSVENQESLRVFLYGTQFQFR